MSKVTPILLKESPIYSKFLVPAVVEGEIREALRIVIREGTRRFGEPGPAVLATLLAVLDAEQLEALCDQIVESQAKEWDDLFRGSDLLVNQLVNQEPAPQPSSVCERILREGRELGRFLVLRRALRRLGTPRFGNSDPDAAFVISQLEPEDCDRIEVLVERVFDPDLETWDDLWRES
jgi:hypothetical protein